MPYIREHVVTGIAATVLICVVGFVWYQRTSAPSVRIGPSFVAHVVHECEVWETKNIYGGQDLGPGWAPVFGDRCEFYKAAFPSKLRNDHVAVEVRTKGIPGWTVYEVPVDSQVSVGDVWPVDGVKILSSETYAP